MKTQKEKRSTTLFYIKAALFFAAVLAFTAYAVINWGAYP